MKKKSVLFINIEYLIVQFLRKFISLSTYRIASDIGGAIGRGRYYIDGKNRNIKLNKLIIGISGKGKKGDYFYSKEGI